MNLRTYRFHLKYNFLNLKSIKYLQRGVTCLYTASKSCYLRYRRDCACGSDCTLCVQVDLGLINNRLNIVFLYSPYLRPRFHVDYCPIWERLGRGWSRLAQGPSDDKADHRYTALVSCHNKLEFISSYRQLGDTLIWCLL